MDMPRTRRYFDKDGVYIPKSRRTTIKGQAFWKGQRKPKGVLNAKKPKQI